MNPANSAEGSHQLQSVKGVLLLWLQQVKVLVVKGLLQKRRRLLNTFFEILTPSLILLALVYGAALSPVVTMSAFSNNQLNVQTTDPLIGGAIIDPNILNRTNMSQLFNWLNGGHGVNSTSGALNGNDLTPFSQSLLFALTVLPNFAYPASTLAQTLQATLYTSTAAAKRTIVPGLDRFIEFAYATKIALAEFQAKELQYFLPFVWEIMNGPGVLTFVPDNLETRKFVAYLNATSEHFDDVFGGLYNSVDHVLQDYPTNYDTQLFDKTFKQRNPAAQPKKPVWAILDMTNFDPSKQDFTYTIRMNSSFVPRTEEVVDPFPQGLGTQFALYVQSGFLTLEFEIGEYIRRLVRNSDRIFKNATTGVQYVDQFTDIFDGMMSYCGKADSTTNRNFDHQQEQVGNLFLQPTPGSIDDVHLQQFLQSVPVIPVLPAFSHAPAFFLQFPCLLELQLYCVNPWTNTIDAQCFTNTNPWLGPTRPSDDKISPTCQAWLAANTSSSSSAFAASVSSRCRIPNSERPHRHDGNPDTPEVYDLDCVLAVIDEVNANNNKNNNVDPAMQNITYFAGIIKNLIHACDDYRSYCEGTGRGADADCFRRLLEPGVAQEAIPTTSQCYQLAYPVGYGCRDEFKTICNNENFVPTSPNFVSSGGVFCLWENSDVVSTANCKSTPLYQDVAIVAAINATYKRGQRYRDTREVMCKFSNRIRSLFSNGIVAGAFDTEEFLQNQFYKNSSAFFGLIAAMAFLFFFTSLVRSIVQDKERGSFRLFVRMGTHWGAFTASYYVLGLLIALPMSLIASFVLWGLMKSIPTSLIFSLMMSYSVSVVSLALLFSCIFSNSNTAAAASPFFMFATAIPGFVVFSGVTSGFYGVLTPAVMVVAFENIALVAQSSTPPSSLLVSLKDVASAMFGLSLLYLFLAVSYLWMQQNYGGCYLALGECLSYLCTSKGALTSSPKSGTQQARAMNEAIRERRRVHIRSSTSSSQQQLQRPNINNPENQGFNEEELASISDTTSGYTQQQNPNQNVASASAAADIINSYSGAVTSHTRNADVSVGGVRSSATLSSSNNSSQSFTSSTSLPTIQSEKNCIPADKIGLRFDDVWCFTMPSVATGAESERILAHCTFVAPKNCLTAIVGISGSGKSSLLSNCIGNSAGLNNVNRFGSIKLLGDVRAETWEARLMSGFCPDSDDALWEQLTALEHVAMVAQIKGVRDKDIATTEARVILHALGLSKDEQEVARIFELSQGIKRRVSVAMALAGGTRFVALDDPSRSVDPTGRRKIYTLLSENASSPSSRCIVFTTNHLTEAEETADHLVLMNNLTVEYYGSPSGLLDQHLRSKMFAKAISMRRQTSCDVGALESKVTTFLPSAKLLNSVGREIRFQVTDPKDFGRIALLIGELEEADFGVGHLQVCDITLEDVVAKLVQTKNKIRHYDDDDDDDDVGEQEKVGTNENKNKNKNKKRNQIGREIQKQQRRVAVAAAAAGAASSSSTSTDYARIERGHVNAAEIEASSSSSFSSDDDDDDRNRHPASSESASALFISPSHIEGNAIGTSIERDSRPTSGCAHHLSISSTIIVRRFASALSGSGIFAIGMSLLCIFIALRILALPDAPQQPLLLNPAKMYGGVHNNAAKNRQEVIFGGNEQSHSLMSNQTLLQDSATNDVSSFSRYASVSDFLSTLDVDTLQDHITMNVSSLQLSRLLYEQRNSHEKKRYGAYFLNDDFVSFYQVNATLRRENKSLCTPTGIDNRNDPYKYCSEQYGLLYYRWRADTLLHNSTSVHALPAFLNSLLTLRACAAANSSKIKINVYSHPLPQNKVYFSSARIAVSLITSLLILVPFAFVPARYVASVVKERESGFLAVQSASNGLTISQYWISTYVWHLLAYTCFALAAFFIMATFQQVTGGAYGPLGELGVIFWLIELSGACFIAMGYCCSFCFRSHATALNFVINLSFLYGFAFVAAVTSVDLISSGDDKLNAKQANGRFETFLKLFPPFALGKGFLDLALLPMRHAFSLDLDITGLSLVRPNLGMMAIFPIYLIGLIATVAFWRTRRCAEVVEKIWMAIPWLRHKSAAAIGARVENDTDEALGFHLFESPSVRSGTQSTTTGFSTDGHEGDEFVSGTSARNLGVVEADSVHKQFKRAGGAASTGSSSSTTVDALRGVSLTASPGQLLVLVGENGSGKSTLLNVLCGALKTDSGLGSFDGEDVFLTEDILKGSVRRHLGVCPEPLGALDEDLTPCHLLHYMADLRCLRSDPHREQHINFLLRALGLYQRRNIKVRHLSSGEKRRVSVGMAMVGFPRAILLDEPSSNLDPISRRFLWTAISCAPASEISWVISTQHVEECHFLGTHAAILKHGRLLWNGAVNNKSDHDLMHGAVILTIIKHEPMTAKKRNPQSQRQVQGQTDSASSSSNGNAISGWEAAVAFVMDNFAPIQIVYNTNCASCYAIGSVHASPERNMNFATTPHNNTNNSNNNSDDAAKGKSTNTLLVAADTAYNTTDEQPMNQNDDDGDDDDSQQPQRQKVDPSASCSSGSTAASRRHRSWSTSSRSSNTQSKPQQQRQRRDRPTVHSVVGKLIEFQEKSRCQFRFNCRSGSIEDAMLMSDKQAPEHSDLQLKVRF